MNVVSLVGSRAEVLDAVESRRCFLVSSPDSGRSCRIDLRGLPQESVLINVDTVVERDHSMEDAFGGRCDCQHRNCSGQHLRCDYLILMGSVSNLMAIYVEVKTGVSDQQGDVAHGFKQCMCSKTVFESALNGCTKGRPTMISLGVVVSPAFALSARNQHQSMIWGITNGIRLLQVRSGDDICAKCGVS